MLEDLEVVIRTIYGEARGESAEGKEAVAHVIQNRAKKKNFSMAFICTAPYQFSCWNGTIATNPDLKHMLTSGPGDTYYDLCATALANVMNGAIDITIGATHYFVTGTTRPKWALNKEPCAVIGHHEFYNNIAW